jgi:hypothetical protein
MLAERVQMNFTEAGGKSGRDPLSGAWVFVLARKRRLASAAQLIALIFAQSARIDHAPCI